MTARAGDTRPSGPPAVIRESLQGKYARFASRFAAFAADVGVSAGVDMLTLAAISFAARVLTGKDIPWNMGDIWVVMAYAAWGFVHFACCRAASAGSSRRSRDDSRSEHRAASDDFAVRNSAQASQ